VTGWVKASMTEGMGGDMRRGWGVDLILRDEKGLKFETVVGRMEAKVVEGLNAVDWVDDTEVRV
jgi:hypothetical protein